MSDKIQAELIEHYLNGTLSGNELQLFEAELSRNPQLVKAVNFNRHLSNALTEKDVIELEEIIHTIVKDKEEKRPTNKASHSIQENKKPNPFLSNWRTLIVAASILFLSFLGCMWYANQSYSNEALVSTQIHFPALRSGEGSMNDLFIQAGIAYEKAAYEEAVQLLGSVPKDSPSYYKAQYALGNVYLKLQQSPKAISIFQQLLQKNDFRFHENVQWSIVNAYLQHGEMKKVEESLHEILIDKDHSLRTDAIEMRKKLDSFWRLFTH